MVTSLLVKLQLVVNKRTIWTTISPRRHERLMVQQLSKRTQSCKSSYSEYLVIEKMEYRSVLHPQSAENDLYLKFIHSSAGTYVLSQNFFCVLGLSWFRRMRNHLCIFRTSQSNCLESPSSCFVSGHWREQYRTKKLHYQWVRLSHTITSVLQPAEVHLADYRTKKGLMYRFGLIQPLQDIVRLSSSGHFCLNLENVGTGLGHKPEYTHSNAKDSG